MSEHHLVMTKDTYMIEGMTFTGITLARIIKKYGSKFKHD